MSSRPVEDYIRRPRKVCESPATIGHQRWTVASGRPALRSRFMRCRSSVGTFPTLCIVVMTSAAERGRGAAPKARARVLPGAVLFRDDLHAKQKPIRTSMATENCLMRIRHCIVEYVSKRCRRVPRLKFHAGSYTERFGGCGCVHVGFPSAKRVLNALSCWSRRE